MTGARSLEGPGNNAPPGQPAPSASAPRETRAPPREEVPEALGLLGEVVPAPRRAPLPLRSVRAPQRPTQSAARAHAPPGGEPGHRPREPARGAPVSALRPGRRLPARAPALCLPACPCLVPPEPRVSQMGGWDVSAESPPGFVPVAGAPSPDLPSRGPTSPGRWVRGGPAGGQERGRAGGRERAFLSSSSGGPHCL